MALSLLTRLRRYIGNRRYAPRLPAEIDAHLLLYLQPSGTLPDSEHDEEGVSLEGQTHDLSSTGLGLLIPASGLNLDQLKHEQCTMQVMLSLPTGKVELRAVPVRYFPVSHEGEQETLFTGAHIIEISEVDRARFDGYLQMLQD